MPLWAIEAIAVSEDSRWQDFPIWAEVVVRAPTPAQARLVAAAMEGGQIADPTTVGNETLAFRSGFQDEKLYQVRQVHLPGTSDDGPDEVLSARQARPDQKSVVSGTRVSGRVDLGGRRNITKKKKKTTQN